MFPARAGMNRDYEPYFTGTWYVPRTRGDEPLAK